MVREGLRPNGYPEDYRSAKGYRRAKAMPKGYYWDDELESYRHFHEDGTDHEFTICLCLRDGTASGEEIQS